MKTALITGSAGLIGSEAVRFFIEKDFKIVGIDNDMRSYFFGKEASTKDISLSLKKEFKDKYIHYNIDIRNKNKLEPVFKKHSFELIIHSAAQPSHDWAAREPFCDFEINANGTLNLLSNLRKEDFQRLNYLIKKKLERYSVELRDVFRKVSDIVIFDKN